MPAKQIFLGRYSAPVDRPRLPPVTRGAFDSYARNRQIWEASSSATGFNRERNSSVLVFGRPRLPAIGAGALAGRPRSSPAIRNCRAPALVLRQVAAVANNPGRI